MLFYLDLVIFYYSILMNFVIIIFKINKFKILLHKYKEIIIYTILSMRQNIETIYDKI